MCIRDRLIIFTQIKQSPENSIAVGNPAKVIRQITEEDKKYYFKNREFDVDDYNA